MNTKKLKPIAVLLSCVCGHAGAADDSSIGLKPDTGGVQLKLQPSFLRLPVDDRSALPIFLDADRIQGHQDKEIEAEGDVRLRRRGQAVNADWLRYEQPENEITGRGNVRVEQRGDVLEGESIKLNLTTDRGAVEKPKYEVQVNATRGRGEGERIIMEGADKYRVIGGSYTSCDVGEDDWFVRSKDLEIDKGRQLGVARNATVEFLGHTILYTPYLSFSLDRSRKSGFLSPTIGSTGNSGTEVSVPYYWNIAPNLDATITPRVLQKRGLMVSNEFRYLEPTLSGEARVEVLPGDRVHNDDNRYAFSLRHTQVFSHGFVGGLNLQKVSDDTYFTDLSTQIAATSQTVLPREASLGKGGTWWRDGTWGVSGLIQRWQTLQTDPLIPVTPPYNRTQLAFGASKQNIGVVDFDMSGSYVDFTHVSLTTGQRAVVYPSIRVPLQTSFAYLTPKFGVHYTHYELAEPALTNLSQNRTVPIYSTEAGLIFERAASLFGQNLTQTLEPKLYYVYIPTRDQNLLPVFDTGLQDVNFATLYAENQFSGDDRINDANQLTVGATSRFLQPESGIERLRVGVAQRYYFKAQEVTLPGVPVRGSSNSDLLVALSGAITPHWSVDAGWQYTTDLSQTQRFNVAARFEPEPGKVINAGYRYVNGTLLTSNQLVTGVRAAAASSVDNTLRQIDLSSQWPLTRRITGVARWNYSIDAARLVEGLAGFEYDADCWAFRVVLHRFVTSTQNEVNSFFMQLELNGLSKIGSNPLDLLRRSISGYYRREPSSVRPEDMFSDR